jgi:hypothetical protein
MCSIMLNNVRYRGGDMKLHKEIKRKTKGQLVKNVHSLKIGFLVVQIFGPITE